MDAKGSGKELKRKNREKCLKERTQKDLAKSYEVRTQKDRTKNPKDLEKSLEEPQM